jgi:NADH dehydrogenase FAD-containing subunit
MQAAHADAAPRRSRIVIIGAGFGGLAAAKRLKHADAAVTVVDRRNYHLFQPLLYQVATAGLSPADIAMPVRAILRRQRNTEVLLDRVIAADLQRHTVRLERSGEELGFDWLVVATGARHAYFGHDEWEPHAPGLKTIEDAIAIRRRLLLAFEWSETARNPAEVRRLLTFAIVGAGPTGVELAGAIAELARRALARDFRHIDPASARVLLIEAGPRVLPGYPEALSRKAQRALERLGVEVWTDRAVQQVDAAGLLVAGERLDAGTVIWAAGVRASAAGRWLEARHDPAGRVEVGPDLSLPGHANVFVIGDTALVRDEDGKAVPGIAPAAKQQGEYVAQVILARLAGRPAPARFHYRNLGSLATIGRRAAVADFGWLRLSGYLAWLLWGLVHIFFLIGFRNRIAVMLDWIWAYLTFQRGARLITGSDAGR